MGQVHSVKRTTENAPVHHWATVEILISHMGAPWRFKGLINLNAYLMTYNIITYLLQFNTSDQRNSVCYKTALKLGWVTWVIQVNWVLFCPGHPGQTFSESGPD